MGILSKRRRSRFTMWSASIPMAIVLVGIGLLLEPARESLYLYIASILCAGAQVVRFIVKDIAPEDMLRGERLEPDEQPAIETTKPIKV